MAPSSHGAARSKDDTDFDDAAFDEALAIQAAQLTPSGLQPSAAVATGSNSGADHKRKREQEATAEAGRVKDPYRAILSTSERTRAPASEDDEKKESLASDAADSQAYLAAEAYKPNAFGDFATYMRHKRMKLKLQEHSMAKDEEAALAAARRLQEGHEDSVEPASSLARPTLFHNACIYINGHTVPPYAEMRRLIHLYGGELMPYLDQKTPVTHIIASNLTAKKRIEFKDYRVVRPEWITQSIAQGKRLDWRDFRCTEDATGALQHGALKAQTSLDGQNHDDAHIAQHTNASASVPADWRARAAMLAAASAESNQATIERLHLPRNASASVGPWGAASRQKSLGTWARRDGSSSAVQNQALVKPEVPDLPEAVAECDTPKSPRTKMADQLPSKDEKRTTPVEESVESAFPSVPIDDQKTPKRDAIVPDRYLSTDPVNPELAALDAWQNFPTHPYASRPSNSKAAQLMASPSWREKNTATGEGFLEGYFGKSRLHHLSTWKSEMREMVGQALREADRAEGSVDLPAGVSRVIMHIDFDAFFVSVGLRSRSDLGDKAVVVCHADSGTAGNTSTSEIASCNYVARSHGIRNGMSLGQARKYCPDVATIPYDFKAYNDIAIRFYTLLLSHADAIEAVSIDEALIDVSFLLEEMRQGKASDEPARHALMNAYQGHLCSQGQAWTAEKQLAEAIRDQIRASTGCEASIGIGSNVLLARLATRKAKPGGSFHLQDDKINPFIDELDIDDLHGVGWSIRNRCKELFGTYNVGQLKALATRSKFVAQFGDKHGITIWDKLHGRERSRLESVKQRQSCGAAVNYAIRFKTDDEAREFVLKLCQEVSNRLQHIKLVGKVCCVSLMVRSKEAPEEAPKFLGHGWCDTFNRSAPFNRATDDAHVIFENAWRLIAALHIAPDQMRGIGVSLQKLIPREETGFPAKREAGQRALSFKPAIKTPEKKAACKAEVADLDHEETCEEMLDSPSAQRTTRAHQRDAVSMKMSTAASQIEIPPSSQLDPAVLDALPASMQEQIRKRQAACESKQVENPVLFPELPAIGENDELLSPTQTLPATPRKERNGKGMDIFTRMLSASNTPSRKGTPSRSQAKIVGPSSVPSTPSGSQQRARLMEWEPTWSQVDPTVLAELPEDVREEVMRQIGHGAGPSRGKAMSRTSSLDGEENDSPTKNASAAILEQKGLIGMMTRSHSESPRKRQAYLDVPGLQNRMAQPSTHTRGFGPNNSTTLPPLLPRLAAGRNSASITAPTKVPDPANVTHTELVELNIDPDVFAALPLSMQQETLEQQSYAAADRKARFKTGRHTIGVTLAQQRLHQRQSAILGDGPGQIELRARPLSGSGNDAKEARAGGPKRSSKGSKPPSIKGLSTVEEVRMLLSSWFAQFQLSGPRERDVQRIASFFVECLEVGLSSQTDNDAAQTRAPPRTRSRLRSLSNTDAKQKQESDFVLCTLQAQSIEKVYSLFQWWSRLLSVQPWSSQQATSREAWYRALNSARSRVDETMIARFGARLSLGPTLNDTTADTHTAR